MKKHLVVAATVGSLLLTATAGFAQGVLTPPGAPAPTMITLNQMQPRTPITNSGAVTISTAGSFYLTTNITVTSGNAVTIAANNVTLDLNGFTISSSETPAGASSGIFLGTGGGLTNIYIFNGSIFSGGITNNSAVAYGGSGFGFGINTYRQPANAHVSNLSVAGCLNSGIYLGPVATFVDSCMVNNVGNYGINADNVSNSSATGCGQYGISANIANNCRGASYTNTAVSGSALAQNCYGTSSGGNGVYASLAQNCYGSSTTTTALSATSAQNCYGITYSTSAAAAGIFATVANNCYGVNNGAGYGINTTLAFNCYGAASSGTGIFAHTGNSCYGVGTTATNFARDYSPQ